MARASIVWPSKPGYICGPLTELSPEQQVSVKRFYTRLADELHKVTGLRPFVPHEHFDPIKNKNATPIDVDRAERDQVCHHTGYLIVVTVAPSWGGGIEVEMSHRHDVPVFLLCEWEKLRKRQVSRLLRGNPAVVSITAYRSEERAIMRIGKALHDHFSKSQEETRKAGRHDFSRDLVGRDLVGRIDELRRARSNPDLRA